MYKFTLYIGSDNESKVLSLNEALTTVSEYFAGFNYSQLKGYWKGEKEDTLKVEVIGNEEDKSRINAMVSKLKRVLKQDCIILETAKHNIAFI